MQSTYSAPMQSQDAGVRPRVEARRAGEYDWRGTYAVPADGNVNSLLLAAESVGADIKPAPTETETKLTV